MIILESCIQVGRGISYLDVIAERQRYYRRFQTTGKEITIKINPPPEDADATKWLAKTISSLYQHIVNDHQDEDEYIGLTIVSKHLKSGSAWLSFMPLCDASKIKYLQFSHEL